TLRGVRQLGRRLVGPARRRHPQGDAARSHLLTFFRCGPAGAGAASRIGPARTGGAGPMARRRRRRCRRMCPRRTDGEVSRQICHLTAPAGQREQASVRARRDGRRAILGEDRRAGPVHGAAGHRVQQPSTTASGNRSEREMSDAQRIPLADHVADAVALLAPVRGVEVVPLDGRAAGRVAATAQRSRVDVPGLDNSQLDGFALAAADLAGPGEAATLPLGPMIAAGDAPAALAPGTARPIMTGAPIPAGADLVVPVEESAAGRFDPAGGGDAAAEVTLVPTSVASGRFVRTRGSDTRRGDTVLREGRRLTPARIAHLAACGVRDVEVAAPVRTLVLSTGTEVRTAGEGTLAPGTLFDAN